ncbi:MAG: hypothetical protein AB8B61_04625 [Cyclobacteriaceae bacterium]
MKSFQSITDGHIMKLEHGRMMPRLLNLTWIIIEAQRHELFLLKVRMQVQVQLVE